MSIEAQTKPDNTPHPAPAKIWRQLAPVAILLFLISFMLLFRLSDYPAPHYDEGAYLKVARNYALNGIYANYSTDRLDYLGPVVSTGPTVILPIALLFKLFGANILLGRIIIVIYTLSFLAALYFMTMHLLGQHMAVLIIIAAIFTPLPIYSSLSRSVMGEIPGLFFVFLGLYLWLLPKRIRWPHLVGAGVCFALAGLTKNQYILSVLPGIGLSFILDWIWYRRYRFFYFVVPGLIAAGLYGAWTYYSLFILGTPARNVAEDLVTLRGLSNAWLFNPAYINTNLDFLVKVSPLFVPSFLYGLLLLLRRGDVREQQWGILFTFLATSTVVYLVSFGEERYAVPVLAIMLLFVARLVQELTDNSGFRRAGLLRLLRGQPFSKSGLATLLIVGMLMTTYARPAYLQIKRVAFDGSNDAYVMGVYLNTHVPSDKVILSWDQELTLTSERTFYFPPFDVDEWQNVPGKTPHMAYIVIGKVTRNAVDFLAYALPDYELVHSEGVYMLYKLKGMNN